MLMNERADFNKKAEEILYFIDAYGMVKHEHLEKLFPGSKKVVNYLLKNRRLYKSADGIYIGTINNYNTATPDKYMTSALNVLVDVFDKVQTHTKAAAPSQISFITHSGDYYEIIYVEYGMETMIISAYGTQLVLGKLPKSYAIKRIVIVEDKNQMFRLHIPGIAHFALVQPDGSLSYFKGS